MEKAEIVFLRFSKVPSPASAPVPHSAPQTLQINQAEPRRRGVRNSM